MKNWEVEYNMRKWNGELRMYKNYIFDLYGTLVGIRTDEEKEELWYRMSLFYGYHGAYYGAEELKKRYFELVKLEFRKFEDEEDREIQIRNVFQRLYEEKQVQVGGETVSFTAKHFRNVSTETIYLYDGVIELFQWLKENGKKIFLLSNAQKAFTLPEIVMVGIEEYFDDIFISSEYGYMKPGTKFYQALIDQYDLNVSECIMVGNDPRSDIEGANRIGMDSLYIHTDNSPQEKMEIKASYKIMDGDFKKVKKLITSCK